VKCIHDVEHETVSAFRCALNPRILGYAFRITQKLSTSEKRIYNNNVKILHFTVIRYASSLRLWLNF